MCVTWSACRDNEDRDEILEALMLYNRNFNIEKRCLNEESYVRKHIL